MASSPLPRSVARGHKPLSRSQDPPPRMRSPPPLSPSFVSLAEPPPPSSVSWMPAVTMTSLHKRPTATNNFPQIMLHLSRRRRRSSSSCLTNPDGDRDRPRLCLPNISHRREQREEAPQRHLNSPPFSSGGRRCAARHLSVACVSVSFLCNIRHRCLDMGTLSVGCRHSLRDGCKGGEREMSGLWAVRETLLVFGTYAHRVQNAESKPFDGGGRRGGHAINRVMTARHGAPGAKLLSSFRLCVAVLRRALCAR